jgi:hypothetical protein
MSLDEIIAVLTITAFGIGGLWAVYRLLSARIADLAKDLTIVRDNYVRRDDFLRVIDRFEKKLDDHLKMLSEKR